MTARTKSPSLNRGTVLRATGDRVDPGGKGVNVSRAVAAAAHRTVAVLPLGGPRGACWPSCSTSTASRSAGVPIAGSTRVNITLVEPDGTLTKVNARRARDSPPPRPSVLLDTVRARSAGADWIACCGSLPRGLPPQWYAELVARSHRAGVRIALDTSGAALVAALRERPDVIKPNAEELAEAVGRPLATVGDARQGRGGAVRPRRALGARQPRRRRSAAGGAVRRLFRRGAGRRRPQQRRCGGRLARRVPVRGRHGPGAVAAAVAHGAAAVQLPGSVMPTPADLDPSAVIITRRSRWTASHGADTMTRRRSRARAVRLARTGVRALPTGPAAARRLP